MEPWMLILLLPAAWMGYSYYRGHRSGAQLQQMAEALAEGGTLVDVRTPAEFSGGHHPRAKNIPLGELRTGARQLDRDLPVVVYCRSGSRSGQALSTLKSAGFSTILDLGPYRNIHKLPEIRRSRSEAPQPASRNQRKRQRRRQARG